MTVIPAIRPHPMMEIPMIPLRVVVHPIEIVEEAEDVEEDIAEGAAAMMVIPMILPLAMMETRTILPLVTRPPPTNVGGVAIAGGATIVIGDMATGITMIPLPILTLLL